MSDSTTDEADAETDIGADKEEDDDDEDEDDDDEQTASAEPATEWVSTIIIYTECWLIYPLLLLIQTIYIKFFWFK